MKYLVMLLGIFMLVGCSPTQPKENIVTRIDFPVDEYANLSVRGDGVVTGHVYMKSPDGNVKVGSGIDVFLNPATSYSEQWYKVSVLGGQQLGPHDDRMMNYMKIVTTDEEGNFKITGVPEGQYYLQASVYWKDPGAAVRKGGMIVNKVNVGAGEVVGVLLTNR